MKHLNTQRFIQALTMIVFVCLLQAAYATLPTSLNYQGHLTDTTGAPVDGSVNMTFRIYNVETSGTVLWSDTLPVTVQQGVFSVELGGTANPFPLGLFEQPLWLGLEVGSDGEMSPRRPITSTGFAFKADDANTLEGVSASTLDQSAHVTDMSNPHNVTAAQVGAADAGTLASHIGNAANPHSVTAAQTGAASSGDFTKHTSNSSAHHTRYTNSEAITAMGLKKDTNALNHDKYSNNNAVAAILAADGAGSTLDADLVDGLQASEIIDAAQDEVRTPISSLPFTISQSGSYYLSGNLNGASGGINITADDVTLDLMGFTINGGGTVSDYGINLSGHSNISIRNGTIKGFGYAGIYQNNSADRYAVIMDVQVLGNGTLGTGDSYSGIYLLSSNSNVERCIAADNGGNGIYAYIGSKVISNTAYNNGGDFGISGSSGAILRGNTAYSNVSDIGIFGGNGAVLTGNTVYSSTGAYGIYGGDSSTMIGNSVYGSTVSYGIYGNSHSTLKGNTANNNSGVGIFAYYGSSISENTVYSNTNWGVYGYGGNLIKDNNIYNNNISGGSGQGGLRVGADSRVVGNKLDDNSPNNIIVDSSDNTIENNLVTDADNGIFFNASGNFYANNRASGNTTNFNLNGTAQSTSTYLPNISF